jgi:RHS repeat-associated protein
LGFTVLPGVGETEAGVLRLEIDYSELAVGQSLDWAARVELVRLPLCAATTPSDPECLEAEVIDAVHNPADRTLTADVVVDPAEGASGGFGEGVFRASGSGGSTYGISAGYESIYGSFRATPLSSSAAWNTGLSTGSFSWSYPVVASPSPWGSTPSVSLNYSSTAVDGVASDENNQGGPMGLGWTVSAGGFIERSYKTCVADGGSIQDFCWFSENATIVLNGQSAELVATNAGKTDWKFEGIDPGWLIQRVQGTSGRGDVLADNNGEWWQVTTGDGTRYRFGRVPTENSVWTVPVYGNNAGEPCSELSGDWCHQAWRWNLDEVIDVNGVITRYSYATERARYGRGGTPGNAATSTYVRAGRLTEIEYGIVGTARGRGRLNFLYDGRCVSDDADTNCVSQLAPSPNSATTADWYPDAPTDLACTPSASTCSDFAPAFYTHRVLARIGSEYNTVTHPATTATWEEEDGVTITTFFKDPDTSILGEPAHLWVESIKRDNVNKISFDSSASSLIDNRVDAVKLRLFRIGQVVDEMGMWTRVTYAGANCPNLAPTAGWAGNHQFCFPRWTVNGNSVGWGTFGVFPVTQVRLSDLTGTAPDRLLRYAYETPAYRRSDSPFVANKTWSEFQGFRKATTWTTSPDGTELLSPVVVHEFFQGMHGDNNGTGGTKTDTRNVAIFGGSSSVQDRRWLTGIEHTTTSYDDVIGGAIIARSTSVPEFVSLDLTGGASKRWHNRKDFSWAHFSGGTQRTSSETEFGVYGRVVRVKDNGDDGTTDDNTCTINTYVDPPPSNLTGLITRTVTRDNPGGSCSAGLLAQTDYTYNSRGLVETQTVFSGKDGAGNATGSRTTTTSYDSVGRVTAVDGPLPGTSDRTTRGYTNSGRTITESTTPDGTALTTVTVLDPWSGQPTSVEDANDAVTTYTYDGLDRLTQARTQTNAAPRPVVRFSYTRATIPTSGTATPATVRTEVDPGGEHTRIPSVVYYNGFAQAVQQDTASPSGRLVSVTRFDRAGRPIAKTDPTSHTDSVGAGVVAWAGTAQNWLSTRVEYDVQSRPTAQTRSIGAAVVSNTQIVYDGARSVIARPDNATDSPRRIREYFNANGQLTHRDIYTTTTSYNRTEYTYTPLGQPHTVVTPAVAGDTNLTLARRTTTYGYNLAGEQTSVDDPNQGSTEYTYNVQGLVATSTNAAGQILTYEYDGAGRQTSLEQNGQQRASYVYDTGVNNKGQLSSTTSFQPGAKIITTNTRNLNGDVTSTKVELQDHLMSGVADLSTATGGLLTGNQTFDYNHSYDQAGRAVRMTYPAIPNLGSVPGASMDRETVETGYDSVGRAVSLRRMIGDDPAGSYVTDTTFTNDGRIETRTTGGGAGDNPIRRLYEWDQFGRLSRMTGVLRPDASPINVQDDEISYDSYGNVTAVRSNPNGTTFNEKQCFEYNTRHQLVAAFTTTIGAPCSGGHVSGSPAAYNHDYDYDAANRLIDGPGGHTYEYAAPNHPHGVTTTIGGAGQGTRQLGYDANGNVTSITRTVGVDQTMNWDALGRMTRSVQGAQTITNLYDVTRQRVLSTTVDTSNDTKSVTLTLPGFDYTITKVGTADPTYTANRYLTIGSTNVAIRSFRRVGEGAVTADTHWVLCNHQGSVIASVNATSGDVHRRLYSPYGDERFSSGPPTSDRGFLNQETDTTGLSYLNNRYYDNQTGVFLSVDPLVAQTGHPYLYGNGNPTTLSDPTGLCAWFNFYCKLQGAFEGLADFVFNNKNPYTGVSTRPQPTTIMGAQTEAARSAAVEVTGHAGAVTTITAYSLLGVGALTTAPTVACVGLCAKAAASSVPLLHQLNDFANGAPASPQTSLDDGLLLLRRSTTTGATNAVDDVFRPPATSINRHGQLTNGTYTIDAAGMAPHKTGSLAGGKSQWWSGVDAERATLDAAAYADANNLWVGAKAKVPATNGTVGVLGRTGEPTEWINVYRNANGFVHGAPGGAG